ncbi:hypothetical protein BofuT4_P041210.1 [Botrytis cinerea T4]|uniref:Uncharacterized protein n=1 Tax=Botryotinia fuckeliana (strain T4) TaxID=999810 RepID=G2Y1H0_BOTF4|nr:hypothetical protein BofuT4_P041210.1 [Botrytis cinerea T4]
MLLSQYQSHTHLRRSKRLFILCRSEGKCVPICAPLAPQGSLPLTGPESHNRHGNGCVRHLISEQVIRIVSDRTAQCMKELLGVSLRSAYDDVHARLKKKKLTSPVN